MQGIFFKLTLKKFRAFLLSIPGAGSMSASCPRTVIFIVWCSFNILNKNLSQCISINILWVLKSHKVIDKENWQEICVPVLESEWKATITVKNIWHGRSKTVCVAFGMQFIIPSPPTTRFLKHLLQMSKKLFLGSTCSTSIIILIPSQSHQDSLECIIGANFVTNVTLKS